MKVEYLPKGSPEFSAVEEYWKQGKMIYWYRNIILGLQI